MYSQKIGICMCTSTSVCGCVRSDLQYVAMRRCTVVPHFSCCCIRKPSAHSTNCATAHTCTTPARPGGCEDIGCSSPNKGNGPRFVHFLRWPLQAQTAWAIAAPRAANTQQHLGDTLGGLAPRHPTVPHATACCDGRAAPPTTESSVHSSSMPTPNAERLSCPPNGEPGDRHPAKHRKVQKKYCWRP